MDGKNNGKTPLEWIIWGENQFFWNTQLPSYIDRAYFFFSHSKYPYMGFPWYVTRFLSSLRIDQQLLVSIGPRGWENQPNSVGFWQKWQKLGSVEDDFLLSTMVNHHENTSLGILHMFSQEPKKHILEKQEPNTHKKKARNLQPTKQHRGTTDLGPGVVPPADISME